MRIVQGTSENADSNSHRLGGGDCISKKFLGHAGAALPRATQNFLLSHKEKVKLSYTDLFHLEEQGIGNLTGQWDSVLHISPVGIFTVVLKPSSSSSWWSRYSVVVRTHKVCTTLHLKASHSLGTRIHHNSFQALFCGKSKSILSH